jgi:hypothetical protein
MAGSNARTVIDARKREHNEENPKQAIGGTKPSQQPGKCREDAAA